MSQGQLIKTPPDRPAFTGFFQRAGAFAIDLLLFYLVGAVLDRVARPLLLQLNPALPWFGLPLVFAYFAVMQGPIGRGRTLGKMVLGLQVVDAAGNAPLWPAALKRAVAQTATAFAVGILMHGPIEFLPALPRGLFVGASIAIPITGVVLITWIITMALGMSLHPRKRTWHDVWARTYVTWEPTPARFRAEMESGLDIVGQRKEAQYFKITLIFLVISVTLLMVRPARVFMSETMLRPLRQIVELEREAPGGRALPGYDLSLIAQPSAEMEAQILKWVASERARAGAAAPTTETLRRDRGLENRSLMVQALKRRGAVAVDDDAQVTGTLLTPAERLRAELWRTMRPADPAAAAERGMMPAERFEVLLAEPLQLLGHNGTAPKLRLVGPADPAAGPLRVEGIAPPPMTVAPGPAIAPTPAAPTPIPTP